MGPGSRIQILSIRGIPEARAGSDENKAHRSGHPNQSRRLGLAVRSGVEVVDSVRDCTARGGNRLAPSNQPPAEILAQAESCRADLLVMGAYWHSRLRERIFAGWTQAMIQHADLPVLMLH